MQGPFVDYICRQLSIHHRHCVFLGEDRLQFLRHAGKEDMMTFLKLILDHYPNVRKQSTVHQYWRQFKMLRRQCVGWGLHAKVNDEVIDV